MLNKLFLPVLLLCSCSSWHSVNNVPNRNWYPDTIAQYHNDFTKKHYPARIKVFKSEPLEQGDIVFLGNSITELGRDWSSRFGVPNIKNRGIAGDITDGVLLRLNEIIYSQPKAVFLLIGVNDLYNIRDHGGVPSPEYVANNILKIAKTIYRSSPNTNVFVQTILPTRDQSLKENIKLVNRIIKEKEQSGFYHVVDLYSEFVGQDGYLPKALTKDGTHLNEVGYAKWVKFLYPLVEKTDE